MQQQRTGNNRARRCLFGSCDTVELREETEKALREIRAEKSQKWNFDFERFTPLPGPYQWKLIDSTATRYVAQKVDDDGSTVTCNQLTPFKNISDANGIPHNKERTNQILDECCMIDTNGNDKNNYDNFRNNSIPKPSTSNTGRHQTIISEQSEIKLDNYSSNGSSCHGLPPKKGVYYRRSERNKPGYKSKMVFTSVMTDYMGKRKRRYNHDRLWKSEECLSDVKRFKLPDRREESQQLLMSRHMSL
ncbi:Cyclin-dependent kinase inhibitor 1B [Trichoplax sp. H2]|nr:Cyclin-dependent kinase inhibitor 1B [Trichoplax sp. H2]|eukprot:RDD40690.1 Cyclin-dependent kinase inhibitor 1B [Trichoplax sp. H2]